MKTKLFFSIVYLVGALTAEAKDKTLLFEFKKKLTCDSAKKVLSEYKIFVDCPRVASSKGRFFSGNYLGKRPLTAVLFELKKKPYLVDVTYDIKAEPIQ